jgi:hypothetical protein
MNEIPEMSARTGAKYPGLYLARWSLFVRP